MTQAAPPDYDSPPRMAGREAIGAWAVRHSDVLAGSIQTAVFLRGTQGSQLIASHPAGQTVPPWLAGIASRAVAQREPVVISQHSDSARSLQAIAHPLYQHGLLVGAVALLRDGERPASDEDLAALLASARELPELLRPSSSSAQPVAPDLHRALLDLLHKMCACHSAKDAAEVLAVGLAAQLDCERVSIGLRDGLRVGLSTRWLASSDAMPAAAAAADIVLAMDEAIDQACTLVYPADEARQLCLLAAHAQASEKTRSTALCTVPLAWRGAIIGALVAERRRASAFDAAAQALLEQAGVAAAAWLGLQQQLEMPWTQRTRQSMASAFACAGKGRYRLAALAAVLALGVLFAWPVDREIAAPVKLEGAVQRIVTAPGDSYLEKVFVRPGDLVKAGQVLVEFAAEDLRVERQRLLAERGGRDAAAAEAMAKQELGTLAVQAAKVKESQAQLDLLDQRLARMRITAPFDAVVIQGDLSNALGAPTRRGDVLMTLAPADNFRAIVEIDESDIGELRTGQSGAMVLTALPHNTLPVRVKGVTPLATVAPGRSFFEAEVELLPTPLGQTELRPGMRGIARLVGARRPRGAVWFEQASAWCRLAWWRWAG